jgi:hypothetical protein
MIVSKMQIDWLILLTHSTLVGILTATMVLGLRYQSKMFSSRRVVLYPEQVNPNKDLSRYITRKGVIRCLF